jgi:ATP/maltotriose-dependent transcriptional regulator MalT
MRLERPRHLAGAALLANLQGNIDEAEVLIEEAWSFARERKMCHIYPLIFTVKGKIALAKGDHTSSASDFLEAKQRAEELGARSLIWQASVGAAEALEASGQAEAAFTERTYAREVVGEIAGLFSDQELRDIYLAGMVGRI